MRKFKELSAVQESTHEFAQLQGKAFFCWPRTPGQGSGASAKALKDTVPRFQQVSRSSLDFKQQAEPLFCLVLDRTPHHLACSTFLQLCRAFHLKVSYCFRAPFEFGKSCAPSGIDRQSLSADLWQQPNKACQM